MNRDLIENSLAVVEKKRKEKRERERERKEGRKETKGMNRIAPDDVNQGLGTRSPNTAQYDSTSWWLSQVHNGRSCGTQGLYDCNPTFKYIFPVVSFRNVAV